LHGIRFLVNARASTLRPEFLAGCKPAGYLVPPAYASKPVRQQLATLPARARRYVLVDNGRYDDLARLRSGAQGAADAVAACLKAAHVPTGEAPPRAALQPADRSAVDRLAAQLAQAARGVAGDTLALRLSFEPDGAVGEEDILASLWYSLGIEPSFLLRGHARVAAINKRVAQRTLRRHASGELGAVADLPVVAAVDYRSAWEAGALYARHGLTSACLPFGALMADDRCASAYHGPAGRVELPSSVPVRVLRAVLVARGFSDGWRSVRRTMPEHLHLLGLGQPLILAMVAAVLEQVPLLTCDATSPFKDAASGTLYTCVPVFRRLDVGPIAANLLGQPGQEWDCPCGFCTAQRPRQRWSEARALFAKLPAEQRMAAALRLRRRDAFGALLPMLCIDPDAQTLAARVGHNHATVQRCVDALNRSRQRPGGPARLARRWVDRYPKGVQANAFRTALQHACALL
jgi:hypothetical protein